MDLRVLALVTFLVNFLTFTKKATTMENHNHKISDAEHFHKDGKHDTSYDHDAFLGKTHSHDFDGLEPEEAKRRLRGMLRKVTKRRSKDS